MYGVLRKVSPGTVPLPLCCRKVLPGTPANPQRAATAGGLGGLGTALPRYSPFVLSPSTRSRFPCLSVCLSALILFLSSNPAAFPFGFLTFVLRSSLLFLDSRLYASLLLRSLISFGPFFFRPTIFFTFCHLLVLFCSLALLNDDDPPPPIYPRLNSS